MTVLLSTTYFGPIQWYQKLYRAEHVEIEQLESFQKQTFRNRCLIATSNGVQALTVPVEHGDSPLIKDLRLSDHGNWRHLHWNALQSAYGESPFFEYYQDDIRPFFERPRVSASAGMKHWEFLLDFNEEIRQKICELIDIHPSVSYTKEYIPEESLLASYPIPFASYRTAISHKHPQDDPEFTPKRYYQVYQEKHGFLPNLSILDLLFNMGPESIFYL